MQTRLAPDTSPVHRLSVVPALAAALALAASIAGCGPAGGDDGDNSEKSYENIDEIRSSEDRISSPNVSDDDYEQLSEDNAAFAFDLYAELADEQSGENFFYSPHSISSALAMTYAGAESSSENQMASALNFQLPEQDLHPAFNKLDQTLRSRADQTGNQDDGSPFKLNIANSIWGRTDYPFKQPFLDTLARHYGAGLHGVDFQTEPDQARESINTWVEDHTEGKIEDLLPEGSINALTRLVLTNAIYFKAGWANEFDEANTEEADFTNGAGETVSVEMMSLAEQNGLAYASDGNWQAVELPYVGEKVSMVVLVPDAGEFGAVEQNLSGSWVRGVFDQLSGEAVRVELPKFDVESAFSVKKMLEALGMEAPFDERAADLTDIADVEKLFVEDVIHQSFVTVDEEGTEAAAATAVTVGTTSAPQYKEVTVDRPFVFMIRDRETDTLLFAGRVLDPS